jgi:hypothetical protein
LIDFNYYSQESRATLCVVALWEEKEKEREDWRRGEREREEGEERSRGGGHGEEERMAAPRAHAPGAISMAFLSASVTPGRRLRAVDVSTRQHKERGEERRRGKPLPWRVRISTECLNVLPFWVRSTYVLITDADPWVPNDSLM